MRRALRLGSLLFWVVGCEHTWFFQPGSYGPSGPFAPGNPFRLTFNPGDDYAPAWIPDESGIIYTLVRLDTPHFEHCLGLLPATGGALSRVICDRAAGYLDSVTVFEEPAVAPDGQLAYVASRSDPNHLAPDRSALVLGTLADPTATRVLRRIPYVAPNGTAHDAITQVRWLDAHTLVYVGLRVDFPRGCSFCAPDTLRTGLEIVRLDFATSPPTLQILAGIQYATSVAPGESPDVVYYTLIGDSRVYRRVVSSGKDSVIHDFGGGTIARDVSFAGTSVAAVVGGNVSVSYDPVLGHPVQTDAGGPLYLLDLSTQRVSVLPDTLLRRPALSPSSRHLVAEAPAGSTHDLWMFTLP